MVQAEDDNAWSKLEHHTWSEVVELEIYLLMIKLAELANLLNMESKGKGSRERFLGF